MARLVCRQLGLPAGKSRTGQALLPGGVPGSCLSRLEVDYAVRFEMARTPADILRRRTGLALHAGQGLAELPAVARQMQSLLAVTDLQRKQWEDHYRAYDARIVF